MSIPVGPSGGAESPIQHATTKITKRKRTPSLATLERIYDRGWCRATDGCKVELDGVCPHGKPSKLRAAGLI